MIDRVTGVLNEIPLSFPARIKKFRRGPGLPMRGESKRLEGSKIPRSNLEIAARKVREKGAAAVEKKERKKRER